MCFLIKTQVLFFALLVYNKNGKVLFGDNSEQCVFCALASVSALFVSRMLFSKERRYLMDNDVCLMIFYENLRRLRQREGLSCEEMANRLNIKPKTLQALESDILPKSVDCMILAYIQKEFGISPRVILGELIQKK